MEKINGILFFVLVGFQITTLLPSKITKIKWQLLIPLITLPVYIWYESYFLRPEVLATVPIRIDLLILHPVIIAGFIVSIIRSVILIKNKEKIGYIALLPLIASFIYWWYYVLVVCMFYQ